MSMILDAKTVKRKFTGKLDKFESKEERNLEKKRLRCYLRGETSFFYGKDEYGTPIQRLV